MLDSLRTAPAAVIREVALPVCQAVYAHRHGAHGQAVALMRPVLHRIVELGGSHAQRDVLTQLYQDANLKAQRAAA
jgi:hypothetical protein